MMLNEKLTSTINTLKAKFLDGWIISLGLSGKDSFAVAHCAIEALKLAKMERSNAGPLYINTVDTTIDNFEVMNFIRQCHQEITQYAADYQLPIETVMLQPPVNQRPMVQYIGRGILLRTFENQANARQCTSDWKIDSVKRFMKSLEQKHQTAKILSLSGSRDSESASRAANLAKRGESIDTIVDTDLGFKLAPIKDWDFKHVWALISLIEKGHIESFGENLTKGLTKHYNAGNAGTCDLLAGEGTDRSKPCSSRFGCVLCSLVKEDTSLQNQINLAPQTYGYMQGLLDLRKFMFDTVNDYDRCRSMIGKRIENGYLKIGYNDYSLDFRKELLRYTLTLDAREQERAYKAGCAPKFQLIKHEDIVTIQFYWTKDGGEKSPGEALQIWHDVHTEHHRYDIPQTTYVPASPMPKYGTRRTPIVKMMDHLDTTGLTISDVDRDNLVTNVFYQGRDAIETTPFDVAERFTVGDADTLEEYVEWTFWDYIQDGVLFDNACPSSLMKDMLRAGVIKIKKGGMPALHQAMRKAQVYSHLTFQHKHYETFLLAYSVTDEEYQDDVNMQAKHAIACSSPQQEMFAI